MDKDYEALIKLLQSSPEAASFVTALTGDKKLEILAAARSAATGNKDGISELMSILMNTPSGMTLASAVMDAMGKKKE